MGLNVRSHAMLYGRTVEYVDANFVDTNHARGYILFPTARRDAVGHRSDEAVRAGVLAYNYRDASWAAFVKAGW